MTPVTNVVFDIGNVFVKWAPLEFLTACFPGEDPQPIYDGMRTDWINLDRGRTTMAEAIARMAQTTGRPAAGFRHFCDCVMSKATIFHDTVALQKRLYDAGVPLYFISDNFKEAVAHYRQAYSFMQPFIGGIVSADVDVLKPAPEIYRHLYDTYDLAPQSCVFFDDMPANVEGAKATGMRAFIFTDAAQCARDLASIGINA